MEWSRFFRRRYWEQERLREIQAHWDIETDENIARGLSPEEARQAARRKLGNVTLVQEEIYRMNSIALELAGPTYRRRARYGAGETLVSGVLPGLQLPVRSIFTSE